MIVNSVIYKKILEKKKRLDSLRPLSLALVNKVREQVIIEWTYNSNAIEGTKLSLKETELVIEQGLTIKGIPLKDHFEAINHKEAILFLEELVKKRKSGLKSSLIRKIHGLILKNIDQENAGVYRQVQVRITGSSYLPPAPHKIFSAMKLFGKWMQNSKNKKNIIDFAALAHFKLVDIHPFIDGNGRTARLLMNLILMKKGYSPTIILKTDRPKYYKTLDQAHRGQLEPFINFIAQNVDRSLAWYLDAVLPEKNKRINEKWQLLSRIASKTPYSQEYLSLLARRGKIEAVKKERNWYSHVSAINDYIDKLKK